MDTKEKITHKNLLSRKKKEIGIISIVFIIIFTFGLFFYQQNITEENIKQGIFNKFRDNQMDSTRVMADHISSDLEVIMSNLQAVADIASLQGGESYDDRFKKIFEDKYLVLNKISKVDGLYLVNKDGIVTYDRVAEGKKSLVNKDISFRGYIMETKNTLQPVFSNGFNGTDNIFKIALAAPIINQDNGQYMGLVETKIPTESFFEHHGNVHDINSQFLVVYDNKGNLLAVGADEKLVGKDFFGETVQNFTNHNIILNNITQDLLEGKPRYAVYDYGKGGRLTTTYPVLISEIPEYFIMVVTPTKSLYSEINSVLLGEKIKTISLIIGSIAAIMALVILLVKWNLILNNLVKKRTKELEHSNKQFSISNNELSRVNEELKVHDRMQSEFINVASHEIKTPIQSILSYSELLSTYPEKQEVFIEGIQRNATRLQRLSSEILDVAKIESRSLKLEKERFNLNDVLSTVVNDYCILIKDDDRQNIKLFSEPSKETLIVEADKERISQVISNLISNAMKFTKQGEIFVNAEKKDDRYALVTVRDTGEGIDSEIFPKLFSKFITTSFQGIGLGLYISKNIIESHGGKIWAENNNNKDGRGGATFYFTIPLSNVTKQEKELE
ncbi:MAG TPA: sensor histidine kinase [Nitrososphaeraceae archaeon]|nr:sensor histidine kinase [Nitrososphaeraceae archaeon]